MEEIAAHLRNLITSNRLSAFFTYWRENIPSTSHHNETADLMKATWRKLQSDEIKGILDSRDANTRRAQLVNSMLSLTRKLTEEPHSVPNPLQDLIRRKLAALERERILATDASVKFKLDEEIKDLKRQLE